METFSKALAEKLVNEQVLFFTGAGLSVNWGHPLGGQVARRMLKDFHDLVRRNDPLLGPDPDAASGLLPEECDQLHQALGGIYATDLPLISELLAQNKCWYIRRYITPDLTGADYPVHFQPKERLVAESRSQERVGLPHIVLGRLAKEGLIDEVMTVNVDALHEAAFELVGLERVERADDPTLRFPWVEAYQVLSDRASYTQPLPHRRVITLHKIHGCIEETRKVVREMISNQTQPHTCTWSKRTGECWRLDQEHHNFVFTYRELLNWRADAWARDLVSDRVRNHHMVFTGFAVADAVSHATFRDIYAEGRLRPQVDPQEPVQLPLLGDKQQGQKQLRAQVITMEANVHALNVLRAANQASPLVDDEQLFQFTDRDKAKKEMEDLFLQVYCRAVVELLKQQIRLRGPGMLTAWLPEKDPRQIKKELDSLIAFLQQQVTTDEGRRFLYHALPNSVRLSWLINDSMLAAGLPEKEETATAYWKRLVQPHYYVPLTGALNVTLQLLRAYQVLATWQEEGDRPGSRLAWQVHPSGWARLPAKSDRPTVNLLPVLARQRRNLGVVRRLGLQPPSATARIGLLELAGGGNPRATQCKDLFADPSRMPYGTFLETISLSSSELWGSQVETKVRSELAKMTR